MNDECQQEIERLVQHYGLHDQWGMEDATTHVIMVDLDSTIADSRQRAHHLSDDTDWEAYAMASGEDVPISSVVALIDALSMAAEIHIVSGRHWASREITERWLKKHCVYFDVLALCPDTSLHIEWKKMWRDAMEALHYDVDLLIDDNPLFVEAFAPTPVVVVNHGLYY